MEQFKKKFLIKSLILKVILVFAITGAVLYAGITITIDNVLDEQEAALVTDRLKSDIVYLGDIIGRGNWSINEEGVLCRGKVQLGDGTDATANISPFKQLQSKTETFSYAFKKCGDEGLTWVGDQETGYQQGHFIRVAGSTRDAQGKSIVGTYIDKKVADVLDETGHYEGAANVAGRPIFCIYRTLIDKTGNVVGCVVVGRSIEELSEQTDAAKKYISWALIILLVIASTAVILYFKRTSDKINSIKKYLDRIGKGDFPEEPLTGKGTDELSLVIDSINEMKESLMEKERMGSELSVATDIQANMLPCIFPAFPEYDGFDIYATMNPAKEVGGDFYDFFMQDENHLAIVIADVSGKGVPAALFMVIAKTLIKNYTQIGLEPSQVFTTVNNILCEGNEAGLFVTAWMAIIDIKTGHVKYVNAGHNPPLIKLGDKFEYIEQKPGLVLAGLEDIQYKQGEFDLKDGDRIYLYTDGVTEATDLKGELYGEDRLLEYINNHVDDLPEYVLHGIRKDIDKFVGEAEQFDDITMLMLDFAKGQDKKAKRLEVEASPDSMTRVMKFIDAELESYGASRKAQKQIDIAVDELYSNVINYAYPDKNGTAIVSIELDDTNHLNTDEKVVKLIFVDSGVQYNPLERDDPDITLDVEDRGIGGLGIFISKTIMDDMEYTNINGYNVLTVYKIIE
ncbi:MAG: SpoIIE family protein phosphatase [Clostridia bacterium]|nr:SpoIIE family protein phosphatase [Clostridia bacterium]